MNVVEQIPDPAKAVITIPVPILSLAGVPIEQWVFALSAILTILFIIEKLPKAWISLVWFYHKLTRKRNEPSK
jgi:hypothetical protein